MVVVGLFAHRFFLLFDGVLLKAIIFKAAVFASMWLHKLNIYVVNKTNYICIF